MPNVSDADNAAILRRDKSFAEAAPIAMRVFCIVLEEKTANAAGLINRWRDLGTRTTASDRLVHSPTPRQPERIGALWKATGARRSGAALQTPI